MLLDLLSRPGMIRALKEARDMLNDLTPLKTNCGAYCNAACCQADESGENGMLLFPCEESFYSSPIEGFPFRLVPDDTLFKGGKRLVCEGHCLREHRPLACRIFPLRLKICTRGDETYTKAEIDPRSWCVCPLPERGGVRGMDQNFVKACEAAGNRMIRSTTLLEALYNEQKLIDEMRRF